MPSKLKGKGPLKGRAPLKGKIKMAAKGKKYSALKSKQSAPTKPGMKTDRSTPFVNKGRPMMPPVGSKRKISPAKSSKSK